MNITNGVVNIIDEWKRQKLECRCIEYRSAHETANKNYYKCGKCKKLIKKDGEYYKKLIINHLYNGAI